MKEGIDVTLEHGQILTAIDHTYPPTTARSYAYCSDTIYEPKILKYIMESDLIYHEATYTEAHIQKAKENFHSTAKEAAEIALMSKCKKLIIGHFSSRYKSLDQLLNEAKSIFEHTEIASEGNWYKVKD